MNYCSNNNAETTPYSSSLISTSFSPSFRPDISRIYRKTPGSTSQTGIQKNEPRHRERWQTKSLPDCAHAKKSYYKIIGKTLCNKKSFVGNKIDYFLSIAYRSIQTIKVKFKYWIITRMYDFILFYNNFPIIIHV